MKTKIVHLTMLFVLLALAAMIVPLAPAQAMSDVPCDTTALINAIQDAVNTGGAQTLNLATNCTYVLTEAAASPSDQNATAFAFISNQSNPVNLTINGNNAVITRAETAPAFRFLQVYPNNTLTLNELTMSGGRAPDSQILGGVGGAINNFATLNLNNVTLSNNRAGDGLSKGKKRANGGYGGAIYNGPQGILNISFSVLNNNAAGNGSSGTKAESKGNGGTGGGIMNFGSVTILHTTLANNKGGAGGDGDDGADGGHGGGIYNVGNATILYSAIYGNKSGAGGDGTTEQGGQGGYGAGVYQFNGKLVLANSTVSGNKAGKGGNSTSGLAGVGGSGAGVAASNGNVTITNSTIAKNKSGDSGNGKGTNLDGRGAGVMNVNKAEIKLRNTIIADNKGSANCAGKLNNVTNNLDTATSCGFGSANSSQSNADPNLEPLANNGGATLTHAFKKPSAAFNTGKDAICNADPINNQDQRGMSRSQGKHCDIGAFELQVSQPTPTATHTPTLAPTNTPTPSPTPTQPVGACAGPSDGRVSCWKGENNANDSVGTNNGTLEGSVTFVEGKVGQAFNFDGTTANVRVPASSSLNVGSANGLTIAAWVNPTTLAQRSPLVEWSNNGTYGADFWMSVTDVIPGGVNGNLYANLTSFAGGTQYVVQTTGAVLTANSWQHVVFTYNKTNGNVAIYVNGVASSVSSSNLGIVTPDTSFDMYLARRPAGQAPAARLSGKMDEVQIWNRALTAQEISSMVGTGDCAGPSDGRVSCWKGDNNANDSVGANNGTVQGGATYAAGKEGQAFSFNGTSGHILVPDSSTLDVTTQFTMSAWVNPAALMDAPPFPGKGAIISKIGGPNGHNGYQYGIAGNNTKIMCQFNEQGQAWPGYQLIATVPGGIPLNTWTHIACTYNNANITAYVNGTQVGTLAVGAKTVVNSASNLKISSDDNGNVYFDGLIDEAQIWNRALTAQEILDLYNAQ